MKAFSSIMLAAAMQMASFAAGGSNVESKSELVMHEWGTFTSVQAADGVQLKWNPFTVSELPKFVYSLTKPGFQNDMTISYLLGKPNLIALQRMETPVIYFYSDKDMTADLRVDFPQGQITEWYPQAAEVGRFTPGLKKGAPRNYLHWKNIQVLGKEKTSADKLPHEASGSHYYAARETAASLLNVETATNGEESEKFLFYRGVGDFEAPLNVSMPGTDLVRLENKGTDPLRNLFLYEVREGRGQFMYVKELTPGQSQTVQLAAHEDFLSLSDLQPRISAQMRTALEAEGLFPDEAKSMTETWKDSWFGEEGLRVLYTLSQSWADEVLPLQVTPAPQASVRVMVGRAELLTPEIEAQLLEQVVRYHNGDPIAKAAIVAEARQLGLGRFAEPAVRRLVKANKHLEKAAWKLANEMKSAEKPASVAAFEWGKD